MESPPRGRVLLVDDEADLLEVISAGLRLLGWECETSANGLGALAKLASSGPRAYDLICTDITMPGMGGVDLAARVRAQGLTIPIVLLTGIDALDPRQGAKCEIQGVLSKPIDLLELSKAFEKILSPGTGS